MLSAEKSGLRKGPAGFWASSWLPSRPKSNVKSAIHQSMADAAISSTPWWRRAGRSLLVIPMTRRRMCGFLSIFSTVSWLPSLLAYQIGFLRFLTLRPKRSSKTAMRGCYPHIRRFRDGRFFVVWDVGSHPSGKWHVCKARHGRKGGA